jgi:2-iminobutanoate/2-iminopropanoate deaminase
MSSTHGHATPPREAVFLPDQYRRPAGAYSPALRAGELVFVSGQVPRDLQTGELIGADVASQTRATLENLRLVLEAAGGGLQSVVAVTAYLADIADWQEFDRAYREVMPQPFPARTTLGAGLHGFLVEISAIALVRADEQL